MTAEPFPDLDVRYGVEWWVDGERGSVLFADPEHAEMVARMIRERAPHVTDVRVYEVAVPGVRESA